MMDEKCDRVSHKEDEDTVPTATFFRLPDDKREKLVSAIKAELSRAPFDEVSINKIIQTAEIPRGSFYQYFLDKKDMLAYILGDYQKQMMDKVKDSLQKSGGDLFQMFEDIFSFTVELGTNEETYGFCKNLFADIRLNGGFNFNKMGRHGKEFLLEELAPNINMELLDVRENSDFIQIIEILMSVTRDATVNIFRNLDKIDQIRGKHHEKIAILKRGLSKNKKCLE